MVQTTSGLHSSMETGQQGDMGQVALEKALIDADYWRNKYDELLKHIEHQNTYCRYLEQQVFGGHSF